MKYFVFLTLFPCIFAAEIQKDVCTDGTQCPEGNYCCELPSGKPGCCEITKEWKNKHVVPALPPSAKETVSRTQSKAMSGVCDGTSCGIHCFPNMYGAICCSNPQYACPSSTKCCSNHYDNQPWCCKSNQTCSSVRGFCVNGAVTCCNNPRYTCPLSTKCCCSHDDEPPWCCKSNQRCSSVRGLCINGAVTTSTAMMSVLFAFMIGVLSKYFL